MSEQQDMTEPQRNEFHRYLDTKLRERLADAVQQHVDKAVKRIWLSVASLVVVVILQSVYIAYVAGAKVQQLQINTQQLDELMISHVSDEANLSAINANLIEINQRLESLQNRH